MPYAKTCVKPKRLANSFTSIPIPVYLLSSPLARLPSNAIMWLKAVYMTHTTELQILPPTTYEVSSHLVNHMFWLEATNEHGCRRDSCRYAFKAEVHFAHTRTWPSLASYNHLLFKNC
jgi:hypothetical protein